VGRDAGTASSSRWLAPLALSAWIALALVQTWPKLSRLDVDAGQYPVQAMQFLAAHRLAGRTVVTFNWAQYAIGCFAHAGLKSTVAVDGRYRTCYSQEVLDRYFDFTFGPDYQGPRYRSPSSGPVDPRRALTCDDPELVLVSRLQRPSVRVMEQHQANWSLLYQDGLSQIWGRKDLFDSPRSSRYLPVEERLIEDQFPRGVVAYPAYPSDQRPHDVVARR
jgi:hypothetical protein